MGCCGFDEPSKEKSFLPLAVGFVIFTSLYLLGFLLSLAGALFSKQARATLRAMVAFLSTSLGEMRSGKSLRVNMARCKVSGRLMNFSPRLAGFAYRNFLPISASLFSVGIFALIVLSLYLVLILVRTASSILA